MDAEAAAEDKVLLDRLRAGDAAAFEKWVRESTPRLLAVTRRLLRNEEDAQDAVQEAFVSAFKNLDGFHGGSKLSTWLHRIAVNAALMKLRSKKRKPEESIEDLQPRFLEDGHFQNEPTEWTEGVDDLLGRQAVRVQVREAIEGLPESFRNVLLLRDIEELDTAEVAKILDISTGAVKTRLHRARIALREQLDAILRADAGDARS